MRGCRFPPRLPPGCRGTRVRPSTLPAPGPCPSRPQRRTPAAQLLRCLCPNNPGLPVGAKKKKKKKEREKRKGSLPAALHATRLCRRPSQTTVRAPLSPREGASRSLGTSWVKDGRTGRSRQETGSGRKEEGMSRKASRRACGSNSSPQVLEPQTRRRRGARGAVSSHRPGHTGKRR